MNSIYDRLFNIPLGPDFADYFLLNLSRGLAGDLVKSICFCLGDTNTGKSTIVKACVLVHLVNLLEHLSLKTLL